LDILLKRCVDQDLAFHELVEAAAQLTPFAVSLRYDDEFWPSLADARDAERTALRVRDFVLARMEF